MAQHDEWLKLAPPPPALELGRKWHVFLSYRSTERPWALALYDILTQLKFQVFMDQFVLVAGEGLASSLGDNLDASQSGVLVWSTRSEDSEWCKNEYNTFESRRAGGEFRFVAVRLQAAALPGFVQGALWIDATEQRDGPHGTSLLRLLFGLQGRPLPPEAVQLAARIDETTIADRASIRSLAENSDVEGILRLSEKRKDDLAWASSPVLACASAQALISIGSSKAALGLLDATRETFPRAIRPRQLTGLALARSGDWRGAKVMLGELYELGERDPETVGIYARTWMDAYESSGDRLMLRRSRDLYAEAFAKSPKVYYSGINAASKSILLGEIDAAAKLAGEVERLVGTQSKAGDYWMSATVAELQLVQRNFDIAASLYGEAVAMAPGAVDDHRSTCRQARLLLKSLGATPEQAQRVLAVFRREIDCEDARCAIDRVRALGRARVVTFTGFSGLGYEDEAGARELIASELGNFDPADTLVCCGATSVGIGMVYPLALRKGFRTAGIVSSQARQDAAALSTECQVVFFVNDPSWGGRQADGRLSPTSLAMVDSCDVMIGIGGGAISRDELEAARGKAKTVRFHPSDMGHARAVEKAVKAGQEPPKDFAGEAQSLFE